MNNSIFDLSGKTALVTGGSRGIGLAVAKGLARHGANIALVARTDKQLEQVKRQIQNSANKKVWAFPFDLANIEAIEDLFKNIVTETKGIDILVNCAGITRRAPAEEVDLADWNQVIEVNLTAVFVISQAFCRHRIHEGRDKRDEGRGPLQDAFRQNRPSSIIHRPSDAAPPSADSVGKIINIGSLMCHGVRPTNTAYACSKGGLLMLTKSLAVEWAKYNINVNAIGPGYIATDLTAPLQVNEELNRWVLSKTPLGRWGQPEDIVGAAVFLSSSASDFITGQIIYVDGGWLAML